MSGEFEMSESEHSVSVVVPVYRGEKTLDKLVEEIKPLTLGAHTPMGNKFRVSELLLVYDGGPDDSDVVIHRLASALAFVRPIWLSKNFGQHAATIAGMASTSGDWIVTLDEDGQFAPSDIPHLLDSAIANKTPLVYAIPMNARPHGLLRNLTSSTARFIATRILSDGSVVEFSSFRLMLGEIGRGIAAYIGPAVYLDVALSWSFPKAGYCAVEFREEIDRQSGYSFRKLLSHFWRLIVSIGPRPLRLVSLAGIAASFAGVALAIYLLIEKVLGSIKVQGWTSLAVVMLVIGGLSLLALGVIAEYVAAAVSMAMGKPLYMIVSDPMNNALMRGHEPDRQRASEIDQATNE